MLEQYDFPRDGHVTPAGCPTGCDIELRSFDKNIEVHCAIETVVLSKVPKDTVCSNCAKKDSNGTHFKYRLWILRVEKNDVIKASDSKTTKKIAEFMRVISADEFLVCSRHKCYVGRIDGLLREFKTGLFASR